MGFRATLNFRKIIYCHMPEQRKIPNFAKGKVQIYWTFPIELFSGIFSRHKSHNSLACVVGFQRGSWERRTRALSIRPNIPVWNSRYSMRRMEQYIGLTCPGSSGSKFRMRENMKSNRGLFYHCLLALGLPWSWNKRHVRWGWQYKEFATDICGTPFFSWWVQESLSNQAFEQAVHSSGYVHIFI